ncbi:MAG: DUF2318 domain-containing protein [Candidatus Bathyarchaeota archaeon]|nr:MAG: DUF2318 domain-containing protein [Candidatus Bathyarchaeota archaeon]
MPGWIKALATLILVGVVASVAAIQFLPGQPDIENPEDPQTPLPTDYPNFATGVFYTNLVTKEDGTKVQLPLSFLKENTIVFADARLATPRSSISYKGRTIPLSTYRNGEYLPLIVIFTPSGGIKTGIRTCEPCNGFSMHIENGKHLVCDVCSTKWDLETFNGISGGCPDYPPPQLPKAVSTDNLTIDLTDLGVVISN